MLRTRWCTSCRLYCCSPLLSCGLMLQCCCYIAQDYTCYWVLCPGFIAHHFLSNLGFIFFLLFMFLELIDMNYSKVNEWMDMTWYDFHYFSIKDHLHILVFIQKFAFYMYSLNEVIKIPFVFWQSLKHELFHIQSIRIEY